MLAGAQLGLKWQMRRSSLPQGSSRSTLIWGQPNNLVTCSFRRCWKKTQLAEDPAVKPKHPLWPLTHSWMPLEQYYIMKRLRSRGILVGGNGRKPVGGILQERLSCCSCQKQWQKCNLLKFKGQENETGTFNWKWKVTPSDLQNIPLLKRINELASPRKK